MKYGHRVGKKDEECLVSCISCRVRWKIEDTEYCEDCTRAKYMGWLGRNALPGEHGANHSTRQMVGDILTDPSEEDPFAIGAMPFSFGERCVYGNGR